MNVTKSLKADAKGHFYRNLGWHPNRSETKLTQPKFLLGRDESSARERLVRLEKLWSLVEQQYATEYRDGKAVWDVVTLEIGRAIARGEHTFKLERPYEFHPRTFGDESSLDGDALASNKESRDWCDADYAGYLRNMQEAYPVIAFIPDEEVAHENGRLKNKAVAESHQALANSFARDAGHRTVGNMQETLHKAIRAFAQSIETNPKYQNHDDSPGAQSTTSWGYKVQSVALNFVDRYEDRPLSSIATLEQVQSFYDYWRARPINVQTKKRITPKTAKHRMTVLTLFFKWMHKSDKFTWRKPQDFSDIEHLVNETRDERSVNASPGQVNTFSERELQLLYANTTTPMERVLMLLALNCGFKEAEIGTLLLGEVHLRSIHPHAELLDFRSTPDDSFVMRTRQKTRVYGEFKLWPQTVESLDWLINRRRMQTKITGGAEEGRDIPIANKSVLLTRSSGYPMYLTYKSGNPSRDIPNMWQRVLDRALNEDPTINQHSYSVLRNTMADLIRRKYGGEIATLYLSHGVPYKGDPLLEVYSNRPFGRLFEAIDQIGERLRPMFDSIVEPFPLKGKQGGGNLTPKQIREIARLLTQGVKKSVIADVVGVHRSTIFRHAATLS